MESCTQEIIQSYVSAKHHLPHHLSNSKDYLKHPENIVDRIKPFLYGEKTWVELEKDFQITLIYCLK